jgi:Zn-dependent peptidase ImmA (M78 family)
MSKLASSQFEISQDKLRLEGYAKNIRATHRMTLFDVLDPWKLADEVPAHIFYTEDFGNPELAERARKANWDGFAFQFAQESTLMVVLNSARSLTRQSATIMEELSHSFLGHTPTRIWEDPNTGFLRRNYNKNQEQEAYDLGATILLPRELLQRDVGKGMYAEDIASERKCSADLVRYRIKRCHLWDMYKKREDSK